LRISNWYGPLAIPGVNPLDVKVAAAWLWNPVLGAPVIISPRSAKPMITSSI
jgi:hypothetical protein